MLNLPIFDIMKDVDVALWIERIFVAGIVILVIPFSLLLLTQIRLLNRFFKTPAASLWSSITLLLLIITVGATVWYVLG